LYASKTSGNFIRKAANSMSHVLKLKLALDVIGGGPLVLEVPEPSLATIFGFRDKPINLNIMSIYITLNNRIMIVSAKHFC
jgi:hypothetical protein